MGIHDRKYMADESGHRRSPMGGGMPKSFTAKYVIVCAVIFLADELSGKQLTALLCLNPKMVYEFEVWRPFSAFVMLNGGTPLIFGAIELFIIWSLGNQIEARLLFKNLKNHLKIKKMSKNRVKIENKPFLFQK